MRVFPSLYLSVAAIIQKNASTAGGVSPGSPQAIESTALTGGNVFEDTSDGEQMVWFTVGGLTLAGAAVGHVLARRCAAPCPGASPSAQMVRSDEEVARLAGTVRVRRVAGVVQLDRWTREARTGSSIPGAQSNKSLTSFHRPLTTRDTHWNMLSSMHVREAR
jgi:hypothetical protein